MRSLCAGLMVVGLVFGAGSPARASAPAVDPVEEALLGLGAAAANTGYLPAKMTVAVVGLATGSLVGLLTGGSERAAYGIWEPLAGGTYILTPAHFTGERPIEFFGSSYADTPARHDRANNTTQAYDAAYEAK